MRKIKRLIALVTVAMFLLSLAPVGALAASKEDAFYKLKGLGVAYGDQNGDPMFDKNYTRAEAAALMVQLSGMGAAADAAKGATKFSDVPGSHWASGVINLAVGAGIIKGYPNGTYKPEANVTYAEMSAMLIQVLGYGPKLKGVWPANVIGKAAELGLLDGLTVANYNDAAIRGQVFIACDNALDVEILEEDADGDGYTEGGKLIDEKFDSAMFDEVDALIDGWSVDADGQFVLELIDADDPTTTAVEDDEVVSLTLAKNAVVEGGKSPSTLKGLKINFVYNTEDDEATFIDLVSTKIKSDDVEKDGTDKLEVNGTKYKVLSGKTLDNDPDTGVGYVEDASLENEFYEVFVDEDNKIYDINVKTPGSSDPKMIENIKADKTVEVMVGSSEDLDVDDLLVVKDGKVATIDALKKTDIIYVDDNIDGLDLYVEAYSTTAKGSLEAGYDTDNDATEMEVIKIDGKKYDLAPDFVFSTDDGETWDGDATDIKDLYDQDLTFALDKSGDVAYILTGSKADSKVIYGVVDALDGVDGTLKDNVVTSLDLTTSTGTTVSYDVNKDEVDLTYVGAVWSGNTVGADVAGSHANTPSGYTVVEEDDVVKITLDEAGKIDSLTVLPLVAGTIDDANKDLKKVQVAGTWRYTNSDTKVIDIVTGDDAEVVSTADFLDAVEDESAPANTDANIDAYVKLDGSKVEFIFYLDAGLNLSAQDKALVLDKYYHDGDKMVKVDIRGEVKAYELDSASIAYSAIEENVLYSYSMSGSEIELDAEVGPVVTDAVYGEVTDIDEDSKSIEIADDVENLSVDADTYIYDMTDLDNPEYVTDFSKISEGDYVIALETDEDDGIADFVFIVDEDDFNLNWTDGGIVD